MNRLPHSERGPLFGIAVGLEDVIHTKGEASDHDDLRITYTHSRHANAIRVLALQSFRPDHDASLTSILWNAGAIKFGRCLSIASSLVSCFCRQDDRNRVHSAGPDTRNPRNPDYTPRGSSTGSAATVADLQVPVSFGTQAGRSLIRPVSYNGVFAMKPTWNAISPEGIKQVSFNIDTCGFFSRSLDDLQLLADTFAIRKYEEIPSEMAYEDVRVAFVKSPVWPKAGPSIVAAMSKAANTLRKHGMEVEEVDLPTEFHDAKSVQLMFEAILTCDAQASLLKEYRVDKTQLDPEIRRMVENASNTTVRDVVQPTGRYTALRTVFNDFASKYSVVITPSAVDVAPYGLDDIGAATFNFLWTVDALHLLYDRAYTDLRRGSACQKLTSQRSLEHMACQSD